MKKILVNWVVGMMRVSSDTISILAMIVFAYTALELKNLAIEHYIAAGTLPRPSIAVLLAIFNNPEIAYPWWNFIATWFLAIGAAGAGWMAILGMRSTWIILIRRISNFA